MKVISAVVRHLDINDGQTQIIVGLEGKFNGKYKAIPVGHHVAYLALDGDVGRFVVHNPRNETGFGGATFELPMEDGSVRRIKGPWSSNPTSISKIFELEDPLVDCVSNYSVVYVRLSVLRSLGIDMVWRNYGGGDDQTKDGYWEARRAG